MTRLFFVLLCIVAVLGGLGEAAAQQKQSETSELNEPNSLETEDVNTLGLQPPQSLDWLDWSDDLQKADSQDPVLLNLSSDDRPLLSNSSISDSDVTRAIPRNEPRRLVENALGTELDVQRDPVRRIATVVEPIGVSHRVVRYEIPLDDLRMHDAFEAHGFEGQLVDVIEAETNSSKNGTGARLQRLFRPRPLPKKTRVVRYDVPAENIAVHREFAQLDGQLLEPSILRLPEVRFFQPKARVFMDLKRRNDGEFDLFSNGAILASLDVVELYFPMPLISERFARLAGKTNRLSQLGWRVGGTVGLGITTALNNGESTLGSAPISTLSSGVRYEFPLGRPSNELITTGDPRFDQRTRVGIESGFQAGVSTNESLADSTDIGWYFGILVNTPWNNYGG